MAREFTLFCDDCGRIIIASLVSHARARDEARLQVGYRRVGRKDLCYACVARLSTGGGNG